MGCCARRAQVEKRAPAGPPGRRALSRPPEPSNPLWRRLARQLATQGTAASGVARPQLQPRTRVGKPGDVYEQEADAVAGQVVDGREGPEPGSLPDSPRANGPLPESVRRYFEPKFGLDFSHVRLHVDQGAAAVAGRLGARALTYGRDIAMPRDEYRPDTPAGRRLLAHELTHVAQQTKASQAPASGRPSLVRRRAPGPMVSGDFVIGRDTSPADQALIEEAFKEICPLTRRDGQRITVDPGDPPENRQAGCHCILDIHNDRRSPHPILSGDPLIVLQRDGWTNSNARHNPPYVSLRHPDSDFDMRYWSEGRPAEQRRRAKPFYLSLAHELCGHVATYVRTDGRETGHRGRYTPLRDRSSHNPAIQTENEIASEHGLPADRGLDVDPDTGQPRPGHRGESFLQARVTGYAHRDTELPAPGASVVTEAARTIQTVRYLHEMELLCQVEGFAYEDEGGQRIARARAGRVREAIDTRMLTLLVPPSPIDPALLCRPVTWAPNLTSIVPGASRRGDDLQRRVHVYLFHSRDAAGS